MARRPGVQFAGAIYHVTFRRNARQAIFADDRNRERLTERATAARIGLGRGAADSDLIRRIKQGRVDMGAYELPPEPGTILVLR